MATKRMFSNIVIESDAFLDLPAMAQLLYFHLGMRTDDDGFVGGVMRAAKNIGASSDDLNALISEGFLLSFPGSKVYLVAHHKINNSLKNDRHHPTIYQTEFAQVVEKDKVYRLKSAVDALDESCIQPVSNLDTTCDQSVSNLDTEHNVAQRNLKKPNVTQRSEAELSGGQESDERETIPLLTTMCVKKGISQQCTLELIQRYGWQKVYEMLTGWDGSGRFEDCFAGEVLHNET